MKKVALITLHGMGKYKKGYELELQERLKGKLSAEAWEAVSLQSVYYDDIFQEPQDTLWDKMLGEPANNLDNVAVRKFFLYSFSDATSFEHGQYKNKQQYLAVQNRIKEALEKAQSEINDFNAPVVIIAQSLGGQVISNYIWDAQSRAQGVFKGSEQAPMNDFLRLTTLQSLITTGCNIPIFVAGLSKRECFNRPEKANNFTWDNFYDPDDALGWPLRQLDKSYEIVKDHPINAGGVFTSWNLLSHTSYWEDSQVVNRLAEILKVYV